MLVKTSSEGNHGVEIVQREVRKLVFRMVEESQSYQTGEDEKGKDLKKR